MTTKERLIHELQQLGLSERQAQQIFQIAYDKEFSKGDYKVTWDRPASEYPDIAYPVLMHALKRHALEYVDKHCPLAWFRPLLEM